MRIAVTTPTGNIGSVVTDKLLAAGADVALLVRDPDKVRSFVERGATALPGSLEDAEYVREATRGADALFWLSPPKFDVDDLRAYQRKLGRNAAEAVRANEIPRVVHLSSVGAELPSGTGPIAGLGENERVLNEVAENATHLRADMFMENHLSSLDGIRNAGGIFFPVRGHVKRSFIATRDIGAIAARRLLDERWSGQSTPALRGPEELSFDEVAAILSRELGKPIRHVTTDADTTLAALREMGASPQVAASFLEIYVSADGGRLVPGTPSTPETTGRTTFAEFARNVLVPAHRAGSPA